MGASAATHPPKQNPAYGPTPCQAETVDENKKVTVNIRLSKIYDYLSLLKFTIIYICLNIDKITVSMVKGGYGKYVKSKISKNSENFMLM